MKVAFLCLAHDNFDYLKVVSEYYISDNDDLFVHVDSAISNFDKNAFCENVRFVSNEKRKRTRWGTFEIVEAALELMKLARETSRYDRYILVSAHDVPLERKTKLKSFLNDEVEHVQIWDLFGRDDEHTTRNEYTRIHYYKTFITNYGEVRNKNSKIYFYAWRIISALIRSFENKICDDIDYFAKGSQWWCITNELCEYFILKSKDLKCSSSFNRMHAPDEKYFHTLVVNSKFRKNLVTQNSQWDDLNHALHYIDWANYNNNKLIFDYEDISLAKKHGCFFARKINLEQKNEFYSFVKSLF